MGNDIAVFQEGELEESFYKYHGPKDESWREFFSRTFSGVMNMLIQPKRFQYQSSDLQANLNNEDDESSFRVEEYSIVSSNSQLLHCAKWIENPSSKLWILYLHTNTRSLVDAQEVLPLCHILGANLISFDLPGCGKSQGNLSFSMVSDLSIVLRHLWVTNPDIEIVVWARGMSTALIQEYLFTIQSSSDNSDDMDIFSAIRYIVLDSPFISVCKMVNDASQTITAYGVTVPSPIISFCGSIIRRSVKSKLGSDPYDVTPIDFTPHMSVPCSVLSARHDDYMPPHHGQTIFEVWGTTNTTRPRCDFDIFEGKHFGLRDKEVVLKPLDAILEHIKYRPCTLEDQLTLSTGTNSPNRILFPSTIFRIPSGSSLASKGSL